MIQPTTAQVGEFPSGRGAFSINLDTGGPPALDKQLHRLQKASDDPALALGAAKDLLEAVGKFVIAELSLQRRAQHLPGTVADNLIQHRPPAGIVNDGEHGRIPPDQRANAGLDQNHFNLQMILGKMRPLSRPLAEAHPQLSDHCSGTRGSPAAPF